MTIRDKILVIEDDKNISSLIRTILSTNGYEVITASHGSEALSMIASHCPELLVLDLGLPDMDGVELIESVRHWSNVPIIVVSARSYERDKVQALDLGADDYVTKPFSAEELLARIRVAMRHTRMNPGSLSADTGRFTAGELTIDYDKHQVLIAGENCHLTQNEYRIWQCNSKFKDKTRCKTPHLTEDGVKAAFIRLVNKLSTDREFYVTELTAIKDRLGDTTALEKERRILDEQLGIDAKAVNDLIAQNARVAQNQTEYNERYDALVSRYEETERRRDEVADRINQIMVRRRKLERFIETVEGLPELYTEFDAGQWAALVDSMTVHAKDRITFTLTCGMVIEE